MKNSDIEVGREYIVFQPVRVRVTHTGLPMDDGKGGTRRAGVLCEDVTSGLVMGTRCDRIKEIADVPVHRLRLS